MQSPTPAALLSLAIAFVASAALAAAPAAPAAASRSPNVLFIMSDDLRTELGCYGVAGIRTPNIDRFAASAVRFDRAYVQYPLCNPSRTSLLTGRYPTTNGVLDNRLFWGGIHPEYRTLPRWFKDHGYITLRTGKIFHGGIDDSDAWNEGGEPRRFTGARDPRTKGQDPKQSDRIVVLDGEGESHADFRFAATAVAFLRAQAKSDRPFFLACGFTKPHSPPTAPKKHFDLYQPARVPLPVDFGPRPVAPAGFPALSVPPRNGDLFIGRDASDAEAHEVKRAYWASVTFVDANVGRVLAALDETGLARNTIVVFWGDHGYHLGEKGKWSKHNSLFEIGSRVPLMFRVPGNAANGRVSPRLVQTLDIYPTLVDLCGLPMPDGLEGTSLRPLIADPAAPWDRPAYTFTYIRSNLGRAVRTERWRYAEWDGGKEGALLFDRDRDPDELVNLAADPAHAATVAAMKKLLARFPATYRLAQ